MAAKTGQIYAARTGAGTALPIVPVRVKAKSSDKFVETYAFLDSGSTATFCSDQVLHLLGIEGKKTILNLTTLGNKQKQTTREVKGLEISSLDGEHTIELPPVFTQPFLSLSRADVPSEEDVTGWPHLRDLELERIDSEVDLLIGVNVPKAIKPWDEKWCRWLQEINELHNFEVDRCFVTSGFGIVSTSELHHFADSSETGKHHFWFTSRDNSPYVIHQLPI
ncbi:uncharacterized protein LOC127861549 [Dreissena polymorpha]|uniref:uncharacterized protein LOC127861549 n=1 Tax=Dreissena polymorpha TaxID=45954 RepID=UPI002264C8E8|nr:uncharacterized protein LOC127861549 [Dreissena polymorpha]